MVFIKFWLWKSLGQCFGCKACNLVETAYQCIVLTCRKVVDVDSCCWQYICYTSTLLNWSEREMRKRKHSMQCAIYIKHDSIFMNLFLYMLIGNQITWIVLIYQDVFFCSYLLKKRMNLIATEFILT